MTERRKSPQQKKAESYDHDRVSTYGENKKSSRKSISGRKRRTTRAHRRAVEQVVREAEVAASPEAAEQAELRARSLRRQQFKKHPDEPLRVVVPAKLKQRAAVQKRSRTGG